MNKIGKSSELNESGVQKRVNPELNNSGGLWEAGSDLNEF